MRDTIRKIFNEIVDGSPPPTAIKMERIVCDGYFPLLNWEWFRQNYPKIEYDAATTMFLSAMHRAIEKGNLYVMVPPHGEHHIGTKLIGNVVTGQRESYWIASADEICSYFRKYWPHRKLKGKKLTAHFFENLPCFCFPMPEDHDMGQGEDPNDYLLFF